jgi:hypothetical protein
MTVTLIGPSADTSAAVPTPALRPAGPAIRLVPVPRSEPPTDEELQASGLEAPALTTMLLPLDLPGGQRSRRRGRSGNETGPPPAPRSDPPIASDRATAVEAPSPARIATRRFLSTCLEVLGGFRPVTHLRPFCFPDRFTDIAERLLGKQPRGAVIRSRGLAYQSRAMAGRAAPPRAGRSNQTGPGDRVSVRRVQVCEAINGVAEIAVVLARREQVWAMALRMECRGGTWLCNHLEVL